MFRTISASKGALCLCTYLHQRCLSQKWMLSPFITDNIWGKTSWLTSLIVGIKKQEQSGPCFQALLKDFPPWGTLMVDMFATHSQQEASHIRLQVKFPVALKEYAFQHPLFPYKKGT